MSEDEPADLFAIVATALRQIPRDVEIDTDRETVIVGPADPSGRQTLAVVLSSSQTVMFYSVWSVPVPDSRRAECRDYVTRANTGLSTATFELGMDNGIVAARSGIRLGDAEFARELSGPALTRLCWLAILDVEDLVAQHDSAIAAFAGHD